MNRVTSSEQSLENPETHISGSIKNTATRSGLFLIHRFLRLCLLQIVIFRFFLLLKIYMEKVRDEERKDETQSVV